MPSAARRATRIRRHQHGEVLGREASPQLCRTVQCESGRSTGSPQTVQVMEQAENNISLRPRLLREGLMDLEPCNAHVTRLRLHGMDGRSLLWCGVRGVEGCAELDRGLARLHVSGNRCRGLRAKRVSAVSRAQPGWANRDTLAREGRPGRRHRGTWGEVETGQFSAALLGKRSREAGGVLSSSISLRLSTRHQWRHTGFLADTSVSPPDIDVILPSSNPASVSHSRYSCRV